MEPDRQTTPQKNSRTPSERHEHKTLWKPQIGLHGKLEFIKSGKTKQNMASSSILNIQNNMGFTHDGFIIDSNFSDSARDCIQRK